jgi:glc operon protein GlcG
MLTRIGFVIAISAVLLSGPANAQAPAAQPPAAPAAARAAPPPQYGLSISVEDAKKAAAAAIAEVGKIGSAPDAVAIVDPGGYLIYFERMDNASIGVARVAIDKARSAALFRRPTKAFEDVLASGGGGMRILAVHGAVPVEGGLPIIADGKVIGAIGGTAPQDGQVAAAGVNALKK